MDIGKFEELKQNELYTIDGGKSLKDVVVGVVRFIIQSMKITVPFIRL